ncbi:hypothetical protein HPP92_005952 [Vanilla planifolia]|uniref:Pentatricopeptide repeat-containing protein n=1 Tax=Vanilla planifolia TaxID=51239 RepID=A0A835RZT3_VANPL|nr:hypothetical protein HPP92_005952 [Vanilla planifolia]
MNCVIQNSATCSLSPPLPPQALRRSRPFRVLVSIKAKVSSSLTSSYDSQTYLTQLSAVHCNAYSAQYSSLIQSCIDAHSFDAGKSIHARMVAEGFLPDTYLQTKILMLYARSGELGDVETARAMFDEMTERNSTAWNTMILAYSRGKDHGEVVRLFSEMMRDGASPAVAALVELDGGDLVAWNAVLGGYLKLSLREEACGTFLRSLRIGITPDHFTFAIVIQACGGLRSLSKGKQVHSNLIVRGYESDVFVGNSLIDMYANCGDGDSCRLVFELMTEKNQVSWNSVISSYVQLGCYEEALHLLSRMQVSGLQCDRFNLGSGLVACSALGDTKKGKQLHGYLVRRYLDTTVILGTAIVDMYSKCGSLEEAHHAFDRVDIKSDVSWNALISGYVQEQRSEEAIETYHRMRSSVPPDEYTYGSLLSLAANQENEDIGRQIHAYMIRDGSMLNAVVKTELVRMYARCGRLREAEVIFSCMQERNSYCWNCLIEGYEENGDYFHALHLFYQMQLNGVNPDSFFLSNALSICTTLSCIARGKQIHGFIIRNAIEDHGILRCMLVVMYAQCENMGYACKVYEKARDKDVFLHNTMISTFLNCGKVSEAGGMFDQMEEKSTVSWNIMLSGYSKAGLKDEMFRTFSRMTREGVNCESSTLVPLFNLCASLPALELGQMLHTVVIKRGLSLSSLILDSVIVDMYSKCGSLKEARMYLIAWKRKIL